MFDINILGMFRDGAPFIEWATTRLKSNPHTDLFDVLLVDMHMQQMHGEETLQRLEQLHSDPDSPRLPVVVALTGDLAAVEGDQSVPCRSCCEGVVS